MSFKPNQNQQITLNDSFINQTPRTQKIIMNSWCKDFADIVFLLSMKNVFLSFTAIINFPGQILL